MEMKTMGRVTVSAKIENISDSLKAQAGQISRDDVRSIEVTEALVDSGATLLGLPKRLIEQLGLEKFDTRRARTSAGLVESNIYRAVGLTIEGRKCTIDVAEVPDECSVLIGYVPLELLDFVIDPSQRRLVPNPKDGGQHIMDLF